jgi:hypothetical protein
MKQIIKNQNNKICENCGNLNEIDIINEFEKVLSIRKQEEDITKNN